MKAKSTVFVSLLVGVAITYYLWGLTFIVSDDTSDDIAYAFFIAGHAYGDPAHPGPGLYEPLKDLFPRLNAIPKLTFGVFLGDGRCMD